MTFLSFYVPLARLLLYYYIVAGCSLTIGRSVGRQRFQLMKWLLANGQLFDPPPTNNHFTDGPRRCIFVRSTRAVHLDTPAVCRVIC